MNDSFRAFRRNPSTIFVAAGLASSLLYVSVILSFAFLLPLQIAYGRFDRKTGLASAGVAVAGILLAQGWRLASAGAIGAPDIAMALAAPLALIGALCLMNASFGQLGAPIYRLLVLTFALAVAAIPLFIYLDTDASIAAYLEERVATFLLPLKSAAGEGYDASALIAALDPKELVAQSFTVLRSSYAAILFLLIGGSWRIGNRLSGEGARGREETPAIDELCLPFFLVWAFLASWALVLAAVALKAPAMASAFAWNCAITLSLAYAAQGLGIVTHLFKSWNMPKSLRVTIAILALLSLATPKLGLAIAVLLPLFGVTEIWIPYRKPKGVGA
jgi:hypothetical protein